MTRGQDLADTRSSTIFTRHVAPTISAMPHSTSASNWVDRGEPADIKVRQIIAHFVGDPDAIMAEAPWLADAVRDVIGMAIADASEVQLAGYLRAVATSRSRGVTDTAPPRIVAIAIWHVVKAAAVRDRAERAMRGLARDHTPESQPLAEWLAERLLSPEELRRHRSQRDADGGHQ